MISLIRISDITNSGLNVNLACHRNDNERFYSYLKFYNLEDLRKQGKAYLKRSNNIPMAVLRYLTPLEKRAELMVFKCA